MLDTSRLPDINDLGAACRNAADLSDMLYEYACNVSCKREDREEFNRLESAISALRSSIHELAAMASVLDGYEHPATFGYPAEKVLAPVTSSYDSGYKDGYVKGYAEGTLHTLQRCAQKAEDAGLIEKTEAAEPKTAAEREKVISSIIAKLDKLGFVSHEAPATDPAGESTEQDCAAQDPETMKGGAAV